MDTVSVTYPLDTAAYIARGASALFDGTPTQWAERFRALGGESAVAHPSWRTGAPCVTFVVTGTPEAVMFAAETAPLR